MKKEWFELYSLKKDIERKFHEIKGIPVNKVLQIKDIPISIIDSICNDFLFIYNQLMVEYIYEYSFGNYKDLDFCKMIINYINLYCKMYGTGEENPQSWDEINVEEYLENIKQYWYECDL